MKRMLLEIDLNRRHRKLSNNSHALFLRQQMTEMRFLIEKNYKLVRWSLINLAFYDFQSEYQRKPN